MKPAAVLFLMLLTMASAVAADAPFERLVQAQSLKCTFGEGSSALWEKGNVTVQSDNLNGVDFFYDSIDFKRGTARTIGNVGAADVSAEAGVYGLTFIERFPAGLSITTVFADYKQGTGEFIAVMSRHVRLVGSSLPVDISQFHGTCVVLQ